MIRLCADAGIELADQHGSETIIYNILLFISPMNKLGIAGDEPSTVRLRLSSDIGLDPISCRGFPR
jgi:hypothetical protein